MKTETRETLHRVSIVLITLGGVMLLLGGLATATFVKLPEFPAWTPYVNIFMGLLNIAFGLWKMGPQPRWW